MSKAKWIALSAAFAAMAMAAPQEDPAGVTVDLNGAALLHRVPVAYPGSARGKNLRGSVVVEVTLDAAGIVGDARVISGPEEFRGSVLQSVLQWHFAHETAGMHRQVTISFEPQPVSAPAPADPQSEQVRRMIESMRAKEAAVVRTVRNISAAGLSDPMRAELLGRLPVHLGDTLDAAGRERIERAVKDFDEHLSVVFQPAGSPGEVAVQIALPNARQDAPGVPGRIRVGGNIMSAKIVQQPRPMYPPDAKQQRIQGVVHLGAVIGKEGSIQQLDLISGHPLLAQAAMDAVRQWVYEPTLLNGNPVEVATQIDVNFTLSQ